MSTPDIVITSPKYEVRKDEYNGFVIRINSLVPPREKIKILLLSNFPIGIIRDKSYVVLENSMRMNPEVYDSVLDVLYKLNYLSSECKRLEKENTTTEFAFLISFTSIIFLLLLLKVTRKNFNKV
jgi:hypothetical protein